MKNKKIKYDFTDEKTALNIVRRARSAAFLIGFKDACDDLAHDVLLKYLSGLSKNQTINQATIDAIRKEFGSERRESSKLKKSAYYGVPVNLIDSEIQSLEINYNIDDYLGGLEPIYRAVLKLFFEWDFSQVEIAGLFGVAERTVWDWKLKALEKVKQNLKKVGNAKKLQKRA